MGLNLVPMESTSSRGSAFSSRVLGHRTWEWSPLLKRGVGFWREGKDISHLQELLTTSERGLILMGQRNGRMGPHPVSPVKPTVAWLLQGQQRHRRDPPGPTPTEGGSQEEGPGGEGARPGGQPSK